MQLCLQDVFKTCLQDVLQLRLQDFFEDKKCYTEDVLEVTFTKKIALTLDVLHFELQDILAGACSFTKNDFFSDNFKGSEAATGGVL